MGGREAIRGFAIQTLLSLLEALDPANDDWQTVIIEPDSVNEKVDIFWTHGGKSRAQQVKSSKNAMTKADVQAWSKDLADSKAADEYEMLLAGPVTQGVIDDAPFHGVKVPTPRALDTLALLEQGSTRLDQYLSGKGITGVPVQIRSDIVQLLSNHVTDGSIYGREHTREEFDGMLLRWVASTYPEAIRQKLTTNCEVLWDVIDLGAPAKASSSGFAITLPVTLVNGGLGVVIVEWLVLKVTGPEGDMRYDPPHPSEFAILPNSKEDRSIDLIPTLAPGFHSGAWSPGLHEFSLFIKMRGAPPRMVKSVGVPITEEHRSALVGPRVRIGLSSIGLL